MTHRVHPYIFRVSHTKTWKSRWFNRKDFIKNLQEDVFIRQWLEKKLRQAHLESVEIERSPNIFKVIIKTSKPGILIGRGGEGAEKLKDDLKKQLFKIRSRWGRISEKEEIKITIEEVRAPETHAAIAAQMLVEEIERRIPFRRVLKQALEKIFSSKDVKGVKIVLKGRLDGAEMARYEWARKGRIPLQTLRADIDYAEKTAYTTYGTVGVKVWIYKGLVWNSEAKP